MEDAKDHRDFRRRCELSTAMIPKAGYSEMLDRLHEEMLFHIETQRAEIDRLSRGEFVCQKCGIRKDSDHPATHDF